MALEQCTKDFIRYMTGSQRAALLAIITTQLDKFRSRVSSLIILALRENILANLATSTLDDLQGTLDGFTSKASIIPFSRFDDCPGVMELSETFQETVKSMEKGVSKARNVVEEVSGRKPATQLKSEISQKITELEEIFAYMLTI